MENLELLRKSLPMYLNHNLKLKCYWKQEFPKAMIDESIEMFVGINNNHVITDENDWELSSIKPILTPMSIFQKMFLVDVESYLECSQEQVQELMNFKNKDIELDNISYGLFERMCEKHIDFNDLISKGLAIDETINKH